MSEASGMPEFSTAAKKLLQNYNHHQVLVETDARNIDTLRSPIADPVELIQVPLFPTDVHDFDGLDRLNRHMFQA
jgi:hypothetical protein